MLVHDVAYRRIFRFYKWESVKTFICGFIGRLLCIGLIYLFKFSKISIVHYSFLLCIFKLYAHQSKVDTYYIHEYMQ